MWFLPPVPYFIKQKLCTFVHRLLDSLVTERPKSVTVHAVSSCRNIHDIPSTNFLDVLCHPLEETITKEVDEYFIQNWNFPDSHAVEKFRAAGFSQVTCYYYPLALNDRIQFACRLLTLLFLIDDLLEDMSFEEGRLFNKRLMPIMQGIWPPDLTIPAEHISSELWQSMRLCDRKLADEILPPVFIFMHSQTDPKRGDDFVLSTYLEYREGDVGKALLSALMRFVMKSELSAEEIGSVRDVDLNCAKHISVINDILGWEKEVTKSRTCGKEGSVLCSSVKVMMKECTLSHEASKRVLYGMCKEWELVHLSLLKEKSARRPEVTTYCIGLGYQMSGSEAWSRSTNRHA